MPSPIGTELMPRASMSPRFATRSRRPSASSPFAASPK
ncbi:Uncharacterised protein [Mycobacteroides abscessus]|nr:Uncharacterised protein [Mycobacteroides abscessus]